MEKGKCPNCGADWDGGSIEETFLQQKAEGNKYWSQFTDEQISEEVKKCYSPPYRWGREIGIELHGMHPKHYDGISAWQCPDCHVYIGRFTKVVSMSLEEVI